MTMNPLKKMKKIRPRLYKLAFLWLTWQNACPRVSVAVFIEDSRSIFSQMNSLSPSIVRCSIVERAASLRSLKRYHLMVSNLLAVRARMRTTRAKKGWVKYKMR